MNYSFRLFCAVQTVVLLLGYCATSSFFEEAKVDTKLATFYANYFLWNEEENDLKEGKMKFLLYLYCATGSQFFF